MTEEPKRLLSFPPFAVGLRDSLREGYSFSDFKQDVLAGLTIGTVAVPLSMALAIATGVPPEYGLYTAMIAGAIIALTGGSRFNISGPTAAFVVILFPIVNDYGIGGLLLSTLMAGIILILFGLTRLGLLIRYVPYPVVLGFTAGIAIIIAVLQIPDFLGLRTSKLGDDFINNFINIVTSLSTINVYELIVGLSTLAILLIWPKLKLPLPAPLVGLVLGGIIAYGINSTVNGADIHTIASRFSWKAHGMQGTGIPPIPPSFLLPWQLPGGNGQPLHLDFHLIHNLIGPAFAIATLGAIESLLCAVIADELTMTKHNPNSELIGQGLGNLIAPFFGGITATAAIARTATNIRSGAKSPVAALIHSIFVLLTILFFANLLGYVPTASLGALLFIVAWNMSEAKHCFYVLRTSPKSDVAILIVCFGLTVIFDMVVAVGVGIALSAALFIRNMTDVSKTRPIKTHPEIKGLEKDVAIFDMDGPLFFGATEKLLGLIKSHIATAKKICIIDVQDILSIDATAIAGLKSLQTQLYKNNQSLIFVGASPQLLLTLKKAGMTDEQKKLAFCKNFYEVNELAQQWLAS